MFAKMNWISFFWLVSLCSSREIENCRKHACMRICCRAEENSNSACISTTTIIVPTEDEDEEINLNDTKYNILVGRPCENMYMLEPLDYSDDRWYFKV